MHSKLLRTPPPRPDSGSPDSEWSEIGSIVTSTQDASSAGLEGLLGSLGMMELEVSYGRLSAKDLKSLVEPLRALQTRSVLLGALWSTVEARFKVRSPDTHVHAQSPVLTDCACPCLQRTIAFESTSNASDEARLSDDEEKPKRRRHAQPKDDKDASRSETARMQRMRKTLKTAERENQHDLATLLPIFAEASEEMRAANDAALLSAMDWLTTQNEGRWSWIWRRGAPKREEEECMAALERQIVHLENDLREYRSKRRHAIVEPFRDFFDPSTGLLRPIGERGDATSGTGRLFAPGSLFTILSASDNLVQYSEAVAAFVRDVRGLAQQRRRNKLWFPTGLRRLGKLIRGKSPTTNVVPDGDDPDHLQDLDDSDDESTLASARDAKEEDADKGDSDYFNDAALRGRDPDARPPRNGIQRSSLFVHRFLHWWTSPHAVFALKYSAASIVCWLPQVFSTTAWLVYSQKGLWTRAPASFSLSPKRMPLIVRVARMCSNHGTSKRLFRLAFRDQFHRSLRSQTFLAPYSGDQFLSTVQRIMGTAAGLVWGMGACHCPPASCSPSPKLMLAPTTLQSLCVSRSDQS